MLLYKFGCASYDARKISERWLSDVNIQNFEVLHRETSEYKLKLLGSLYKTN